MGCNWNICWNLNTLGMLGESGTDKADYCRKVVSGRKVAGAIKFLVNARSL